MKNETLIVNEISQSSMIVLRKHIERTFRSVTARFSNHRSKKRSNVNATLWSSPSFVYQHLFWGITPHISAHIISISMR